MRVQLIRKLADRINGIDLSGRIPGDILELSDRDAARRGGLGSSRGQ